jgi:two-component system sensor histidine kinase DegS
LEIEQEENEMRMEVQRRLMEYREKERQEIARDLHDGPLQLLSGTIFNLQAAKEAAQDPLLRLELEQAAYNLKAAIRELRDTMNALRPPAIIRFGLAKSARMHAEDFREKHPEIILSLHMIEDQHLLSETARLALFRIYQESLNNIVKHAGASRVWVRTSKKGDLFTLQIRDNGNGFHVPADLVGHTQNGHYGLAGMKERAEAVGGTLTIISEPGKGTKIQVIVPYQEIDRL